MRPGVYIEHTITKLYSLYNTRSLGIVTFRSGATDTMIRFTTYSQAQAALPENSNALLACELFFAHVSGEIFVIEVATDTSESYLTAINRLLAQKEIYCITTDFENEAFLLQAATLISTVDKLFIGTTGKADNAITTAQAINNERVCLTMPKITTKSVTWDISPTLLAILILRGDNVGGNLIGQAVVGEYNFTESDESVKNSLLYNGVNVFEKCDGRTTLIRGVTTRTHDADGSIDTTYRNISVVMAIDSVKMALATSIAQRLSAGSPVSSGAVLALIVSELVDLRDKGIISDYERPSVTVDTSDSSVCNVGVNVTINQGINQIYVNINMNI